MSIGIEDSELGVFCDILFRRIVKAGIFKRAAICIYMRAHLIQFNRDKSAKFRKSGSHFLQRCTNFREEFRCRAERCARRGFDRLNHRVFWLNLCALRCSHSVLCHNRRIFFCDRRFFPCERIYRKIAQIICTCRIFQFKRTDTGTAQRGKMSARATGGCNIACQCADIRSF